jgi:N-acetylglucosamine-6-phosphate deacetylase
MAAGFAFLVGNGMSVPGVAWLSAVTPARRHGLVGVGVIEVGARADLCVVDTAGGLQRVLAGGEWVDR